MDNRKIYETYTSSSVFIDSKRDKLTNESLVYYKKRLIPHLPKDKSIKILDIGAGYGRLIKALNESGYYDTQGIDISEEQVSYARNVLGVESIITADAVSFLNKDASKYDAIFLVDILEHLGLDESIEVLSSARKCLSENGLVIVQVPNGLNPLLLNLYGDITHMRAYTPRSLKQSFTIAKFSTSEFYDVPPVVRGFVTAIQYLVYKHFIKNIIRVYLLSMIGYTMGDIFSPNLVAIARK